MISVWTNRSHGVSKHALAVVSIGCSLKSIEIGFKIQAVRR